MKKKISMKNTNLSESIFNKGAKERDRAQYWLDQGKIETSLEIKQTKKKN